MTTEPWRALRERAVEEHDLALARYPTRLGGEFTRVMSGVVASLQEAAIGARSAGAEAIEVSKTLRWLGDAYFDLARGQDSALLVHGSQAYDEAEGLLATEDAPLEQAKLDFNYGNTLRGLARGNDTALLEVVEARYHSALKAFNVAGTKPFAEAVRGALATLEPQLTLARGYRRLGRFLEDLCELAATESLSAVQRSERLAILQSEARKVMSHLPRALDESVASLTAELRKYPERAFDASSGLQELMLQATQLKQLFASYLAEKRDPGGGLESVLLGLLQQRLEQAAGSGEVSALRASQLREILERGRRAFSGQSVSLAELNSLAQLSRELLGASSALVKLELGPALRSDSRAERALSILSAIFARLSGDKVRVLPAQEAQAASTLLQRSMAIAARANKCSTTGDLDNFERDTWGVARDWHEYTSRYHVMLATPIYQTSQQRPDARTVFLSGGDALDALAMRLRKSAGLSVPETSRLGTPEERWNRLWSATVAVFDIAVAPASALAQVCYELGLALALGKPCVVLSRASLVVPFDIALPITFLTDNDSDLEVLLTAVTGALAEPRWGGAEAGLQARFALATSWLERHSKDLEGGTFPIALRLAREQEADATAFGQALERALGELGANAPLLLRPAWPPSYPDPREAPCCFHVMPFGRLWSNSARELSRGSCEDAGFRYTRGDEAQEQRIIRSIWQEIASASAVLVDVTNHNPNVALELGLAHAVGRPSLLVAQGDIEQHKFAAISKLQILSYSDQPGHSGLSKAIANFLHALRPHDGG